MKWKKLGKIFEPQKYKLCRKGAGYAQSPQAVPILGGIRVFFSTRELQKSGKFLSHISYVDFNKSFSSIQSVASKPVIELGGLGVFDEHGIFPVHMMKNDDELWAYTTGWNRKVSVSADASIGLAISSNNGRSFEKVGKGPILSATLNEPFLIGDPFVLRHKDRYVMWYTFGQKWIKSEKDESSERVHKIGCATSKDGISWTKLGRLIIPNVLGNDECQALPSVVKHEGVFHMIFCFREAFGFRDDPSKGYRLGYAFSDDGIHWERDDQKLNFKGTPGTWDGDMQCYPHFFSYRDDFWLLYNGNHFGRDGFGLAKLEEW